MSRLHEYVELQRDLIIALKSSLGQRDWKFLSDVPHVGKVRSRGCVWHYSVHGTGVRFQRRKVSVDANSHLDGDPALFDAGRLVEYLESISASVVEWRGLSRTLDYQSAPILLREVCRAGEILKVEMIGGEIYHLP